MRKTKTIKIDNLEVTFKELRVRDVRALMDAADELNDGNLAAMFDRIVPLCCDFPKDKLEDLAPSEMVVLYEAFKDVNEALLSGLKKSGLLEVLEHRWRTVLTTLPALLLNGDTPTSSTTAGGSS